MGEKNIINKLFEEKIDDLSGFYEKIAGNISKTNIETINKDIKEKLAEIKNMDNNRVLAISSILKFTGSSYKELIPYFCLYLNNRINLTQFNFLVKTLFDDNPPLHSDIIFDIAEYTYLDSKVIERKINDLTSELKPISDPEIQLFLLILFFRDDLRNENYRLIYELLLNIGGSKIKELKNNKVVKDFLTENKPVKPKPVQKPVPKKPESSSIKEEKTSVVKTPSFKPEKSKDEEKSIEISTKKNKITKLKLPLFVGIPIIFILVILILFVGSKNHKKNKPVQKQIVETSNQQPISKKNKVIKENASNQKIGRQQESQAKSSERKSNKNIIEEYVIKKGDTLSGIAKKYYGRGYYYKHLADVNKIQNPDLIYPGTKIEVPKNINKNN